MRKSIQSPLALVAIVALTLALSACGGDDSTGSKFGQKKTDAIEQTATPVATDAAATDEAEGDDPFGDDSTKGSTTKLCKVLDTKTITSISGVDFSKAVATDDGDGGCQWSLESLGIQAMAGVMTTGDVTADYETTRSAIDGMYDVTDVSVTGVDHAFTYMDGRIVGMVLDGEYVQVMYASSDVASEDASVVLKLAEEVVRNW